MVTKYSIRFFLRASGVKETDDKASEKASIYFKFRLLGESGKKLKYPKIDLSTGLSINPKFWDKDKQRVKSNTPSAAIINSKLNTIKTDAERIAYDALIKNDDAIEALRTAYVPNAAAKKPNKFFAYIENFIEKSRTTKAYSTIQTYQTALNKLKDYSEKKNVRVDFDTISYHFFTDFANYLIELRNTNNTIEKGLSTVKTFLSDAEKEGIAVNPAYRNFSAKQYDTETEHFPLTLDELKRLIALDLTEKPTFEIVRDGYVVMALTGVRYSDLIKIQPVHVKVLNSGEKMITLYAKKTTDKKNIPLPTRAAFLLEKHGYNFTKPAHQNFNVYIKEICALAKIDDEVELFHKRGNEQIRKIKKKYEVISAHTARHTCGTLQGAGGQNPLHIKDNLGHKKFTQTQNYIKDETDARIKEGTAFFDGLDL